MTTEKMHSAEENLFRAIRHSPEDETTINREVRTLIQAAIEMGCEVERERQFVARNGYSPAWWMYGSLPGEEFGLQHSEPEDDGCPGCGSFAHPARACEEG